MDFPHSEATMVKNIHGSLIGTATIYWNSLALLECTWYRYSSQERKSFRPLPGFPEGIFI
jgi:hypothetical protein